MVTGLTTFNAFWCQHDDASDEEDAAVLICKTCHQSMEVMGQIHTFGCSKTNLKDEMGKDQ
jgi:protein-arginine kinase activator protein McsA